MGRDVPRVPVAPLINLGHAAKIAGIKPVEYILHSDKYASAQLNAKRYYGYDWMWAHQFFGGITRKEREGVVHKGDHAILTLEVGVKYKISDTGPPQMIKPALTSPRDVENLMIPDAHNEERLEPLRLMRENEGFLCGNMRCPFTLASTFLYDLESFLLLLKTNEDAALRILDWALEYCIYYARAQVDAGVDAIYVEDPTASNNVISPKDYRKYALPYERKFIREIGAPVILHICGDINNILDDVVTTGAKCISIDEMMNMEIVRERIPVWGNVSVRLLVDGSPAEVADACKSIVEMKNGVVLSSACVVPRNANTENVKAMVMASHG